MYDLDTEDGMRRSIEWTERLFAVVSDGAVWVVPRSGTHIHIFKDRKEVHIHKGFAPDDALARVIEAMGWTVCQHNK